MTVPLKNTFLLGTNTGYLLQSVVCSMFSFYPLTLVDSELLISTKKYSLSLLLTVLIDTSLTSRMRHTKGSK